MSIVQGYGLAGCCNVRGNIGSTWVNKLGLLNA